MTLVPSYASIRPDNLVLTSSLLDSAGIEWLLFPQGPHLILVTVVLLYASPGPSDSVPHLGLHGPSDSGPHPGIIGTWILSSTPGPHLDLVTLACRLASPGPGEWGCHLGLTHTW